MSKFKVAATSAAAVLVLAVASTAYVAAEPSSPQGAAKDAAAAASICKRQSAANSAGQDIFLSTSDPQTYTGTAWQNVACTTTSFKLQPGQRALVTSDFNAEADCNGTVSSLQWCLTRALLNGVEGEPTAPEPSSFAFDSVAGGTDNWQAHAMNRAWEVTCQNTSTQGPCTYRFAVQTRMHATGATSMWLDDIGVRLSVTPGAPAAL